MKKVKIYTTPSCVYCRMAKEYFKKKNIEYEEFDVFSDLKAREEMVKKTQQYAVPVIEIDNHIIVGFDRLLIDKLLNED